MTQITDEIIAESKLKRFVNRFEPSYHLLACHTALPLVLTPELVNYIRVQFLRREGVPWIAEADLLLSDLCRPVGYELYVMDEAVRAYLLGQLEEDNRFGDRRIKDIARLLLNYIKHLAKTNLFLGIKDLETQKWGAMLYLDTEQTVREIARAIAESVNPVEIAHLLKIAEDFKKKIAISEHGKNFLEYAQIVNDLIKRPETVEQKSITRSYQIADIELAMPEILVNPFNETFKIATFKVAIIEVKETYTFEFIIATLQHRTDGGKWLIDRQQSQANGIIEILDQGIELELMEVPPGTFWMGAPENESKSLERERPQHQVTVPTFYMGRYPITQRQWTTVAAFPQVKRKLKPNPSQFKGDNRPVEQVSWDDAVEFCDRLSKHTNKPYRLPSEAEWEYACRAGTTTPFHFGQTITTDLVNYDGSYIYGDGVKGIYREETTEVGSFGVANNFGLYDIHGNVWEWCRDYWHESYKGAPTDGSVWLNKNNHQYRVLRGGSWRNYPVNCRSANRIRVTPDSEYNDIGFRVVLGRVAR